MNTLDRFIRKSNFTSGGTYGNTSVGEKSTATTQAQSGNQAQDNAPPSYGSSGNQAQDNAPPTQQDTPQSRDAGSALPSSGGGGGGSAPPAAKPATPTAAAPSQSRSWLVLLVVIGFGIYSYNS